MSPLVTAEIVAAALVLLALAALAYIFVRRRLLASGSPLMLCALRAHSASGYRLGLMRFAGASLEWFTLVGFSLRPRHTWDRVRLEPDAPGAPSEVIAGLPEAVEVTCHYGTDTFQLALSPASYTAMRSWLESAPPGFNVNVA
ncbi:MAG TPA: DUF2550 domain-containing protein [Pedococcus sp.]|jgi:hypothetical protein